MKLEALQVTGLHGHISHHITFHDDLTLLVGINGCGKTSLLNSIDWLLRFDIRQLCSVKFDCIELTYREGAEGRRFVLRATQDDKQLKVELVGGDAKMKPVTVDFLVHPKELDEASDMEMLFERYAQLTAEPHERPLWTFLRKIEKPVVITLDRALSAEVGNDSMFIEEMRMGRSRRSRVLIRTPINKVKQVTTERHARYAARAAELNERLKTKIVMSAFRAPPTTKTTGKVMRPLTIEEVSRLQKKVTDLVSPSTKGELESSQIATYFGQAKKYLQGKGADQKEFELFAAQFRQIEALADAFDEFDRDSAAEYEPIKLYLTCVNRFFEDSGKRLAFVAASNALTFHNVHDPPHSSFQSVRDVACLSSGERQILVLFTFLAFVATEDSVFIIDEPELSLHPKWQMEFLRAFLDLRPRGTQVLLATHSPEIVAEHKKNCFVLDAPGVKK